MSLDAEWADHAAQAEGERMRDELDEFFGVWNDRITVLVQSNPEGYKAAWTGIIEYLRACCDQWESELEEM